MLTDDAIVATELIGIEPTEAAPLLLIIAPRSKQSNAIELFGWVASSGGNVISRSSVTP
jgi:hypothetical protein